MPGIERTTSTCRKRMRNPRAFDARSFRTITLKKGTQAVIGCPKGRYNPSTQRCTIGTEIQTVIKKKNRDGSCPSFRGF